MSELRGLLDDHKDESERVDEGGAYTREDEDIPFLATYVMPSWLSLASSMSKPGIPSS